MKVFDLCPKCKVLSFRYDTRFGLYRCLNLDCLAVLYKSDIQK